MVTPNKRLTGLHDVNRGKLRFIPLPCKKINKSRMGAVLYYISGSWKFDRARPIVDTALNGQARCCSAEI
jgi:hypothetical protein